MSNMKEKLEHVGIVLNDISVALVTVTVTVTVTVRLRLRLWLRLLSRTLNSIIMTEDFKSFSYGLSSSVIKIIVTSIISLIIAPIILNNVDDKTYGAILMITEFTAWFTLVQLGTSTVLSSRLPKFILDGDELKVNKYQGTAFLTQILFGILVLVLFSLVLFWFDEIFPELSNIPGIYLIFIVAQHRFF